MTGSRLFDRRTPPHVVTLVLLAGLSALAMNIFLPSLPNMARHFDVDYATMQLSVSAYLAVSAAVQLLVGPVSDRFGRRPVILGAILLFLLATLGTLVAPDAGTFLACRMAQAVVATCMVLSRAVVRDMVPGPEAASLIGYVTMGMSLAPMLGPVLGGALEESYGWRANFFALGAFGIAIGTLAFFDLGETQRGGGTSLAAQVAEYPELLRSRRFWGYALAASLSSGSFFAYLGGAPFVGTSVFGLRPAEVGYYFACPAVGYAIGNYISGRYSVRMGIDRMVSAGALIASLALAALLAVDLAGLLHPALFFPIVGVMALGNGLLLPNANAGLMSVRPRLAGTASGLGGTMIIGGGAALAALVGALLHEGNGATMLILLMLAPSLGAQLSIQWVKRRRAALGV